ncbi:MAG: hypothetical protein ACP5FH_00080 [Terracidiphilus sp.]
MTSNVTDLVRAVSEQQQATDRQLNALTSALQTLEARVAELSLRLEAATQAVQKEKDEVTPEVLAMMAAVVTAYLGKKVRIRSAKMLQSPYEVVNPWSQQGRVFVQASHNLRPRG